MLRSFIEKLFLKELPVPVIRVIVIKIVRRMRIIHHDGLIAGEEKLHLQFSRRLLSGFQLLLSVVSNHILNIQLLEYVIPPPPPAPPPKKTHIMVLVLVSESITHWLFGDFTDVSLANEDCIN